MHHIGLSHSPFQQRQPPLASPTTFGFSSPILSQAFSPPTYSTPKAQKRPASASTGVSSASDALQDITGNNGMRRVILEAGDEDSGPISSKRGHTKQEIANRLYGLIDLLEDENCFLEDVGSEILSMRLQGLEDMVRTGLKTTEETIGLGIVEDSKQRLTLEQIRQSEEDSYLSDVSPAALQEVRVKVERQRRRKHIRQEIADSASEHGSRSSSRWRQDSTDSSDLAHDGHVAGISQKNEESVMSPRKALNLAVAAQDLNTRLLATLTELQNRKIESDEIHDLLVQRCEASTERILLLEYRIAEMEDDFSANASELKFLRLQLQAIEAQCAPYIDRTKEEDVELSESIMNWKIDWEEVNRRSMARRGRKDVVVPPRSIRGRSAEVPLRRTYSEHGT